MRKVFKFFLIMAFLGGVVYLGYGFYKKSTEEYALKNTISRYIDEGKNFIVGTKNDIGSEVSSLMKQEGAKSTSYIGEKIAALGESLKNFSYNIVSSSSYSNSNSSSTTTTLDTINNKDNISFEGNSILFDSSFAFVVNANTEFKLFLQPSLEYDIDWGDGIVSQAKNDKSQSAIVSHSWGKEGYYKVSIKLVDEKNISTSYIFSIRVLK